MDLFINEQREEEKNAEKYGKDSASLYELDKAVGKSD